MAPTGLVSDVFPALYACCKVAGEGEDLYDVKFYPWATVGDEQVFAVIGKHHVFVCRPKKDADPPFEVLQWFTHDEDLSNTFNSLAWTKDPVTRKPLLCVAGAKPKTIQILDVEKGEKIRSLVGHGSSVNNLDVSPLSANLLASAGADYTLRLWDLRPGYERQPCVAIFAGEGHRQPLLWCQFHPNGKWIFTAGLDTAICLWAVPSLEELERDIIGVDLPKPVSVYFPHFHSTEVHHNYVDCVHFFGDLILSRCALDQTEKKQDNTILLWKIEGFDSEDEPPTAPPIPAPGVYTRSSFPHDKRSRGFQRLLTFEMPYTNRFYLRFGLLHTPGMRPILAMANEHSRYHFWDLQKLEEGYEPGEEKVKKPRGRKSRGGAAASAVNFQSNLDRLRGEGGGGNSVASDAGIGTPDPSSTSVSAPPERKYDLGDPFMPLKPHHSVVANTSLSRDKHFGTTQIAWSPDGTWMVGVGDQGMVCIFHREKERV